MRRTVSLFLALVLLLTLFGCGKKDGGAAWQEQYDLGIRYLSDGNYEEAIIAFNAAIEIDPKRMETYSVLGTIYMDMGDYENAVEVLEQGFASTGDAALKKMLDDAKKLASVDFEHLVSDAYSYAGKGEWGDFEYHIPKINLSDPAITQLNSEIYDALQYEQFGSSIESDTAQYGAPVQTASYEWAVNNGILSLVAKTEATGYAWSDYYIYNVSVLTGEQMSTEALAGTAGFTMDAYYSRVEQASGSWLMNNWNAFGDEVKNASFRQQFNEILKKTVSAENVQSARPYLNADGELCVVVPIYSFVSADYYYQKLNLIDFVLVPDYKSGVEDQTSPVNISKEQAYQTACEYWDFSASSEDEFILDNGMQTSSTSGKTYYCYTLQWTVDVGTPSAHASTADWLYIDAETGECFTEIPA